ncbi:cobalamin biosynthesis protein [Nocardia arizonensis]|uniref:cobalamin biosynthesis protein n=1 Tax=Nocardia arizonensis TaxID=1141647 RepID=UPI0006D2ADE1|nr:cobalamin biosynthesis protein [Nocardia arizonensis]
MVNDRGDDADRGAVTVGLGLRPGVTAERILGAIREVLGDRMIGCLATLDRRAAEAGVRSAARALGVPVVAVAAEALADVDVPNPGPRVRAAVGTGSVAEAAAVIASGGGRLVRVKTVVDGVVVAAAR